MERSDARLQRDDANPQLVRGMVEQLGTQRSRVHAVSTIRSHASGGDPVSVDDLMGRLLAELTDTTVTDVEVAEMLTGLADECRDVLGVEAVSVLLVGPLGRLELRAWSDGAEHLARVLELQTRQGPCLESSLTDRVVAVDDLAADDAMARWPLFTAAARTAGIRSAGAIPMRAGRRVIGALGLLGTASTPMDADALTAAQALVAAATAALVRLGSAGGATVEEQLARALGDRVVIEQAKGIISERDAVDIDEAFAHIREHARLHRLRLVDVAHAVIAGTLCAAELDPAPQLRVALPCSSTAPGIARRAFDAWATPLGVSQQVRDDARLIVSELVPNAVTHAGPAPTLEASRLGGVVRIEVRDEDPTLLATSQAASSLVDGSGGHGLWIVQRLSDSWGCVGLDVGKIVWSEIH
jgi:anti-sigma regulatory factor (Ser/Thr protein kinase)